MQRYFVNIFLASVQPLLKICSVSSSFTSFLPDNNNLPITLLPTNQSELQNICRAFKSGKSLDYDNIPMHIIKKSSDIICDPIVNVINLSLAAGIFPDKLKIAKVIPIYKEYDILYCIVVSFGFLKNHSTSLAVTHLVKLPHLSIEKKSQPVYFLISLKLLIL